MIWRATGEVRFLNGLSFTPHIGLLQEHLVDVRGHQNLSIAGWSLHLLGEHESEHGRFEVQAVSDPACRIQTVLLSHLHPFYADDTSEDSERRAFHEGVLETDLCGQREFSWGSVFCKVDGTTNKDWIVVVYEPGPKVPLLPPFKPHYLRAHAPLPELEPEPELKFLEDALKRRISEPQNPEAK